MAATRKRKEGRPFALARAAIGKRKPKNLFAKTFLKGGTEKVFGGRFLGEGMSIFRRRRQGKNSHNRV